MRNLTWVMAANSAHARIFKLEKGLKLSEIKTFIHTQSRMHEKDLVADKPGAASRGKGEGRVSMEQQIAPKKAEAINFARQIAAFLEEARVKGKFNRIFIAANPLFLGLLRRELSPLTVGYIAAEAAKDITHFRPEEIIKYFPIGL